MTADDRRERTQDRAAEWQVNDMIDGIGTEINVFYHVEVEKSRRLMFFELVSEMELSLSESSLLLLAPHHVSEARQKKVYRYRKAVENKSSC
jgi:hypothetical protein